MATLVAITFEDQESAGNVLRRIRQLEREGKIRLADTAVLVREQDGQIHTQNELDSGVETGAVVGGILGMALTFIFPLAGLVVGAAGGALVGRLMEKGVDRDLVKEVRDHLQPGLGLAHQTLHEKLEIAARAIRYRPLIGFQR